VRNLVAFCGGPAHSGISRPRINHRAVEPSARVRVSVRTTQARPSPFVTSRVEALILHSAYPLAPAFVTPGCERFGGHCGVACKEPILLKVKCPNPLRRGSSSCPSQEGTASALSAFPVVQVTQFDLGCRPNLHAGTPARVHAIPLSLSQLCADNLLFEFTRIP
jgi:hypothetical protein